MTTIVAVALAVLFGAVLIGKMLLAMYPGAGRGAREADESDDRPPEE